MVLNSTDKNDKKINQLGDQFSRRLFHIDDHVDPVRITVRIAGIYIILGALWILLSELALLKIV